MGKEKLIMLVVYILIKLLRLIYLKYASKSNNRTAFLDNDVRHDAPFLGALFAVLQREEPLVRPQHGYRQFALNAFELTQYPSPLITKAVNS